MLSQFLAWYLVIQLLTIVTLPLSASLFANLADRGYVFAKSLGILLVGFVLWFGTSYGLLRNEAGGAWMAVSLVGLFSFAVGRPVVAAWSAAWRNAQAGEDLEAANRRHEASQISRSYILVVELLFLLAFAGWAYVRAHDPAANHTEKPMDLMFMNSIWVSPTYPPQDAWLSGYAISYYYFGYWLLTTVGRLAGQPPAIAFNVGQACWFGLLLIGCSAVVYNLLRHAGRPWGIALIGGVLGAVAVGVTGNLQVVFEWLYASGVNVASLARWFAVDGFPENAQQSGQWYIGFDWWWWRSSRVLEDLDLLGQHIEVIDEFPIFSYVLGDNHPHVLAMPFVLLVIGMAQNLFFAGRANPGADLATELAPNAEQAKEWRKSFSEIAAALHALMPMGKIGWLLAAIASGALIFLNTWDFPPYWLLLAGTVFALLLELGQTRWQTQWRVGWWAGAGALLVAIGMLGAAVILYLPYFLTAQSQAGGFVPNLFNPTRFPQFLLMFGYALCGVVALVAVAWPAKQSSEGKGRRRIWQSLAGVYGGPLLFLAACIVLAFSTEAGRSLLERMALPEGASSHLPFILARWRTQGLTFLVTGGLLGVTVALVWQRLNCGGLHWDPAEHQRRQSTLFALFLTVIGLLLVYIPEFVFLRDNFGTRMNTIFKFYYQAWLLLGLASTYAIMMAMGGSQPISLYGRIFAALSLLLILVGLVYPAAAAYSKTQGFALTMPTFDATAYVAMESPAELAAIAWVRANTAPGAVILEGKGASYRANFSRISTATGRPTLLGWDGHESQWRGAAYGGMATGRAEALDLIYRSGGPEQIVEALARWGIDYVYIGPSERSQYGMTSLSDERLAQVMDLVFEQDNVRIYQRRGQ
jgi:YYY domain-containing protein